MPSNQDTAMGRNANPFQLQLQHMTPITLPPRILKTRRLDGALTSSDRTAGFFTPTSALLQSQRKRSQVGQIGNNKRGGIAADRKGTLSLSPTRARAGHDGRVDLSTTNEPIDFDPFTDSPSFELLSSPPTTHSDERCDPRRVQAFRRWLGRNFPNVVRTFRCLKLLHERSQLFLDVDTRAATSTSDNVADDEMPDDANDGSDSPRERRPTRQVSATRELKIRALGHTHLQLTDDEGEVNRHYDKRKDDGDHSDSDSDDEATKQRAKELEHVKRTRQMAQERAWRVLFRYAFIKSIVPGQSIVVQDSTTSGNIFFVLNGTCDVLFQPKFLAYVLHNRKRSQVAASKSPAAAPPSPAAFGFSSTSPTSKESDKPGKQQDSSPKSTRLPSPLKRRMSLTRLTEQDVQKATSTQVYLRTLHCGDHFGLDSAMFQFGTHLVTVTSSGALQRNPIGVTLQANMHVLIVPFTAIMQARECIVASLQATAGYALRSSNHRLLASNNVAVSAIPRTFPFLFDESAVDFLRQTFLFQSIKEKNLQFLAAHMRSVKIPKHEYLFTTGQDVQVYLVRTGQLKVFTPEQVRISTSSDRDEDDKLVDVHPSSSSSAKESSTFTPLTTIETRHVELEILQTHDIVGLMEASLTLPSFSTYCIATSADVEVLAFSAFALFSVLSQEPTASHQVLENLQRHHAWYKLRRFTALNHHNKQTEFKLSLAAQRKSPIQCSRCGWTGHVSTSSICVRAESPKLAFIKHIATASVAPSPVVPAALPTIARLSRAERRRSSLNQRLSISSAGDHSRSGSMVEQLAPPSPDNTVSTPTTANSTSSDGKDDRGRRKRGEVGQHLQSLQMDPLALAKMFQDAADKTRMGLRSSALFLDIPALAHLQNQYDDPHEEEDNESDLEKALKRLDMALIDAEDLEPERSTSSGVTPRVGSPTSIAMHSRLMSSPSKRHDSTVFNLKEAAVRAVTRISASTPGGQASPSPPPSRLALPVVSKRRKNAVIH
ncbi:TPA: hypothetical protein N0F65_009801 [Lagenidium giganteum]|uniref:Cyclic nucleotide-binding domain-containing protein n=1 Tax=Lagenidium giganteum TaxID=4803 RepID=A0AAV2YJ43_9STRA|nr:TPA: hypothetical protein N0F65_009801 [Lagenidium giganteum]